MKGRIEKWCCMGVEDKTLALPEALGKVAAVMEKIVHGRQALFFLDDLTSMLFRFIPDAFVSAFALFTQRFLTSFSFLFANFGQ